MIEYGGSGCERGVDGFVGDNRFNHFPDRYCADSSSSRSSTVVWCNNLESFEQKSE